VLFTPDGACLQAFCPIEQSAGVKKERGDARQPGNHPHHLSKGLF
jgi:hypothetical protein